MMVTMAISLFTSRVILQTLGVDDYGLYQAVGGIVGFMSFLNGALSSGSGRFLTFALGKGNSIELKNTFSTVFIVHLGLALLVILVAETFGLWFLYNKMVIPADRLSAAVWVFHISIVTAAINITQVPYTGCITAHEKFNLYAYVSIIEAVLKLLIVYLLYIGNFDKLILYATLFFLVQAGLQFFYRWYCRQNFEECHFDFYFDKSIFKPVAKFSGWSLFSNGTIALNNQGVLLLLNMFFPSAVVASRAISLQVDGILKQFVNNFKTASNPQIIKRYATGDKEGSKKLLLQTSNLSFCLFILIVAPVCVVAEPLLNLWLGVIPDYAVAFLQLILIQNVVAVYDTCFYQAFNASGRLKENAIVSPLLNAMRFIVVYVCFKQGCSPLALSYAGIGVNFLISWIAKPALMVRYLDYKWSDFVGVFSTFFKVSIPTVIISTIMISMRDKYIISNSLLEIVVFSGVVFVATLIFVWYLGLKKEERSKISSFIKSKLTR